MHAKMLVLALSLVLLRPSAWMADLLSSTYTTRAFSPGATRTSWLCTRLPGTAIALLRVERDTLLPLSRTTVGEMMSSSGVRPGPHDSLLATPTTLMPAARVRLMKVDSATRAVLMSHGVTDDQPFAYVQSAPYRADCRTVRWTDTVPFAVQGEVGYVRGHLSPPENWVDGKPVFVIPDAWKYPYPRRRGVDFLVSAKAALAPAEAMFSLNAVLEMPRPQSLAVRLEQDSIKRGLAMAWARDNPSAAEMEPVRTLVRRAVLGPDWQTASRMPSRLRGSYRMDIDVEGTRGTMFFRTHDRPGYEWVGLDSAQTTAALLASPHVFGYRLAGLTAASRDSLMTVDPTGFHRAKLVWLGTNDRPTTAGNDASSLLSGFLEFQLAALPETLWNDLEAFVPPTSGKDSAMMAQLNRSIARGDKQARLPLTLMLNGPALRADTMHMAKGRRIRIVLERIDTVSVRRPF